MTAATWSSGVSQFNPRHERAMKDGLVAAAEVLKNQVKRNLRGGYTSGAFVTGRSVSSVTRTDAERGANGFFIRVGTNLLYNLYWEIGHHNIFTRRFERQERWRPAMMDSRAAMQAAFTRVYMRTLRSAA